MCAQVFSALVTELVENGVFWAFWVLLGALCISGVLTLLVYPSCVQGSGHAGCAHRWTPPLDGGRWEHYLRDLRGVRWFAQKIANYFVRSGSNSIGEMSKMPALAGQPSLHVDYACMVYWAGGVLLGNCRPNICETFFSQVWVFLFNRISGHRF